MKAITAAQLTKNRRRFARGKSKSGNLALAQLFKRNPLIVVSCRDRDFQKIKKPSCDDRGPSAGQIDIHILIGEIGDSLDVLSRQEMELLIIELCNVGQPILDTRK